MPADPGLHIPRRTRQLPRPAARLSQSTALESCPLEPLMVEAAEILRLIADLRRNGRLRAQLDQADERPPADEVVAVLRERLCAIEQLAAHRHATSPKGALFQLLLAAGRAQSLTADAELNAVDGRAVRASEQAIARLHYSGLAVLCAAHGDGDLELLREHYLPRSWHVLATCDGLMARHTLGRS